MISADNNSSNLGTTGKVNKLLSIILAAAPLLAKYSSIVPGVNLGELFLILSIIIVTLRRPISFTTTKSVGLIWVYTVYIWILIPITLLYYSQYTNDVVVRTLRFTVYIFILLALANVIDWAFYIRTIELIVILNILFLLVQYIIYNSTGRYVQGYGYLLEVNAGLSSVEKERLFSYSYFRPSAFFLEPSHLSQYSYPILNYALFRSKENKKIAILVSVGIILSTSLWGYIITILSWIVYFVKNIRMGKSVRLEVIGLLFFLMLFVFALQWFSGATNSISRIDYDNILGSSAFSGRFMTYGNFEEYTLVEKIVGRGFGYIGGLDAIGNSLAYILLGTGVIGVCLVYSWLISLYRTSGFYGKVTVAEYSLLILGSATFNSLFMPVTIIASMEELNK